MATRAAAPPPGVDSQPVMHTAEGQSIWLTDVDMPAPAPLTGKSRVDVCIVGAGITGLSTAYLLSLEGLSVAVLDRQTQLGGSETSFTTAHLSNALDRGYRDLILLHDQHKVALAAESHSRAISLIESIVAQEQIDCDFARVDGYLLAAPGADAGTLEKEWEAARKAGVAGVELLPNSPMGTGDLGPCVKFPHQAQFHPLKYLAHLARVLENKGVKLYGKSEVAEIQDGTPLRLVTKDGAEIEARHVVVATNTPFNDRLTMHTKQAAYRTYAIALRLSEPPQLPNALLWDTADPFHYVRLHRSTQKGKKPATMLIVGGEDHKTGQGGDTATHYDNLDRWARERFAGVEGVELRWSGQIIESADGLAYIGKNPGSGDNIYIATGDSGNGMTYGTIAAMLLKDLILSRPNEWAGVYDPSRIPVRAAATFTRENLNVAAQFSDWVTPGEVNTIEEVANGAGALLRRGLEKIAVYRDEHGNVIERSAVCPHLGCLVHWNSAETTWDCPCHGSRFSPQGEVLNGPATTGLVAVEASDAEAPPVAQSTPVH